MRQQDILVSESEVSALRSGTIFIICRKATMSYYQQCNQITSLNPILPGGGAYFTPLRFFCSTVQTATAIAMIFGDF